MKKAFSSALLFVTAAAIVLTAGFLVYRNLPSDPILMQMVPEASIAQTLPQSSEDESAPKSVNINTATWEELASLPGIGEVLAKRIVAYRENKGPFQALTDLLKVEGIGEKKLEKILDGITLGG